jgi:hypothetical protein
MSSTSSSITSARCPFNSESLRHFVSRSDRASELTGGVDDGGDFGPVCAASSRELALGFRETIRKNGSVGIRCWDNGPSFLKRVQFSRTARTDEVIHTGKFKRRNQAPRHFLDGNDVDARERSQHRPARDASMFDLEEQGRVNAQSYRLDVFADLLRNLLQRPFLAAL